MKNFKLFSKRIVIMFMAGVLAITILGLFTINAASENIYVPVRKVNNLSDNPVDFERMEMTYIQASNEPAIYTGTYETTGTNVEYDVGEHPMRLSTY